MERRGFFGSLAAFFVALPFVKRWLPVKRHKHAHMSFFHHYPDGRWARWEASLRNANIAKGDPLTFDMFRRAEWWESIYDPPNQTWSTPIRFAGPPGLHKKWPPLKMHSPSIWVGQRAG